MTKIVRNFTGVLLAIAMFTLLPATNVMAQEVAPEHLAMAREYVDLTDHSGIYEISLIQAGVQTMQTLIVKNPEVKDQLDEAIGKTIDEYVPRKDELFDQFARIYASLFTIEELREIVAFYKSETGQKLSKANATANADLQAVMKIYKNNLETEFFAKVRGRLKEMGLEL